MFAKFLTVCVVAGTMITAACAQNDTKPVTPNGPKLEFVGGSTFDWGKVKPPKEGFLEGEVKMKNVGNALLKLVEIRPGCGCTKTDPDKMEVTPGDVSTMKIKLNISGGQVGPVTKSITVRWAGPSDTVTDYIWLKADIQRDLMLSQQYISFENLKVGQETSASITITNNSKEDIVLSDWTSDNGLVLNVVGKKVLKPTEKLELVARVVPSVKGNYNASIKAKTTNPDTPELSIPAYGNAMETQSKVFPQSNPK